MNKHTIPAVVDIFIPSATSTFDPCLLAHFNRFNTLIHAIEQGKFHLLSASDPEKVRSDFDFIFNSLLQLLIRNEVTRNVWIDVFRPIALGQYRRIVRTKLTAMDERVKKKRAKLRTETVDALFVGLYKMITMFEEIA